MCYDILGSNPDPDNLTGSDRIRNTGGVARAVRSHHFFLAGGFQKDHCSSYLLKSSKRMKILKVKLLELNIL